MTAATVPPTGDGAAPIRDYGLLSDCQGAALVSRDGSIDWACLPRFDSPAVFAQLLGRNGGHWQIRPPGPYETTRIYLDDTLVLRTEFHTPDGVVALTDVMVFGADERGHHIGRQSPHVIVRRVEGRSGTVELDIHYAPRAGYGLTAPVLIAEDGGVRSRGGPSSYLLSSQTQLHIRHSDATARVHVTAGQMLHFAMEVTSPWGEPRAYLSDGEIEAMLESTISGWRSWSNLHQSYRGPYAEAVRHSGRVLQALTYAPTGAMIAAPTTSLPETVGGSRNWDYRFCWVRDASLTLAALWIAACPDEAGDFFSFLATAAGGRIAPGENLQILYSIEGERLVPEHHLDHLDGYLNSRPVRIGNGAWNQPQLDVYGELLDAAWTYAGEIDRFEPVTAQFLIDVANTAADRWTEPDHGIWEVRGRPRHFVHSKLMCWVALDRAIRLADKLEASHRLDHWSAVRDQIRGALETQGWNDAAGAYTQSFGSEELDASSLLLLLSGFLPPDDQRMLATVEAVADRLTDSHGFVYRYRNPDGLDGEEGTFAICTFWLIQSLAEIGQQHRARSLFERISAFANDVGLFSEEIDTQTGQLLGNFPQAFTHIGLINAAWAIARTEDTAPARTPPEPPPGTVP
ncbi:MAG: glycoside hydrolase family 15 protein [Acidobacteriota bacterium]|nr:glycoside hydrolase family 15 protein [Acidobacteriota bacterium]